MRDSGTGDRTRPRLGIRGRLVLLVTLISCMPIAGLAYSVAAVALMPNRPDVGPLRIPVLIAASGLLLAGVVGFVIWDLVGRLHPAQGLAPEARSSVAVDPGVMTNAWQRMLCTIERQTEELDRFSTRLDTAYQEIETANARLRELSFKDELTRLYNRRFFAARLEEEIARHRRFEHPLALLLVDVDGLKAVNDELGHAAGDETLRGVADILLKHSRGIDVIGRYGGDEFAVLLVEATPAGACQYADRIRRLLAAYPFGHGRRITASFGVAGLPDDGLGSGDALINGADEALYAAKRAGKDRIARYDALLAQESQAV